MKRKLGVQKRPLAIADAAFEHKKMRNSYQSSKKQQV